MVDTEEFNFGGPRSFPWTAEHIFVFQFWYCELSVKNQWGRDRNPNFVIFVVWSALIVSGWVGDDGVEQSFY